MERDHHGAKVAGKSCRRSAFIRVLVFMHNEASAPRQIVLLDLAGEAASARVWAEALAPGAEIVALDKAALKQGSKREILASLRAGGSIDVFAIFCSRLELQPSRALMLLFGKLAGARRVAIGDTTGRTIRRGWAGILAVDLPLLALELVAGYVVVVPTAWIATWIVGQWARRARKPRPVPASGPLDILYLRATPAAASAVGGSTSHIAGMVKAAAELGHSVRFVANDVLPEIDHAAMPIHVVAPSGRFSTVRAVFEIWNSLVFTAGALRNARGAPPDLVYQRYNRFNAAGVVLSLALGRPLCLEFNGSEIWVAENWDPVGQRRLLGVIERLNLHAAALVVVVSEVLAADLERMGVERDRILVNPNGADPERFAPGSGGDRVRRELGLDGRLVAGFLGTFGPWHGVDVLARAIVATAHLDLSYLLVGDGDLRPAVERAIDEAGARDRVVFAGRIAHSDVPAHLDACDILLSPHVEMPDGSAFFGSPTKLFEYLAMGRPVVASRLGQIGDVIRDGETGLLVPPGSVEALVAAIERLAADPELRERLGTAARKSVISDYTWRRNAERVLEKCRSGL